MSEAIINFSILLAVATTIILVLQALKQPPIIGYIFAGIALGPSALSITNQIPGLEIFGEIGIAFLLFILGINIDIKSLQQVGVTSIATGLGQILFTFCFGFGLATLFGFSGAAAIYMATGLTFSSTIIIVKLLSDREEINSLHGRIAVGFLIVQDIVAVVALMFISAFAASQGSIVATVITTFIQAAVIFVIVGLISKYILPHILKYASKNQEVLFVFGITWCIILAGFFDYINFSLEIGALIAGLMLASTKFSYEIASKIRPLRDFFIILFFITLGAQLEIQLLGEYLVPAITFSLLVLIGNPLIVMSIMGWQGFEKRTSFMAGLAVSQISEFGLIIVALGLSVGHVGANILNLTTIIALSTILISSYSIIHADTIYARIQHLIPYYQRGVNPHSDDVTHALGLFDAMLFGYGGFGKEVRPELEKDYRNHLVVDFDPTVVAELHAIDANAVLADAKDADIYDLLGLEHPKVVVCTVPDPSVNNLLLSEIRRRNPQCVTILTAHDKRQARNLYGSGADLVIIPQLAGGERIVDALTQLKHSTSGFARLTNKHRKKMGP